MLSQMKTLVHMCFEQYFLLLAYTISKLPTSTFARIMKFYALILITISAIGGARGAKILALFPLHLKSHFACADAVVTSLSSAGHEVTIFTPFVKDVASRNYTRVIDSSNDTVVSISRTRYNANRDRSLSDLVKLTIETEMRICNLVIRSKEYQEILNSADVKFDVVFVVMHFLHNCFLPIAEKLKVPVIGVTPFKSWYPCDRAVGNIMHPADVPYEFGALWKFDRFYERFINTLHYVEAEFAWRFYVRPAMKKFYRDNEDVLKAYSGFLDITPSLIFYNSHHSILARPMNPNVIEIGGLQVVPAKPLPEYILKFIEEAEYGVILFTFGSRIRTSSLPSHITQSFINVFATIPQRVIWKYEEKLDDIPKNVLLMEWLPQRDILEHPNVKAFISHCGQGGIYEAIFTATPIIACPLRVDQPVNAAILDNLGIAVGLDIDSISEESILAAVNAIINDTKYYDNMQKFSIRFKDRPLTPQQSVVYWTEYIIRHKGAANLKPPSSRLNWFQYFFLDILCIIGVSFISCLCLAYLLISNASAMVRRKLSQGRTNKLKLK